MDPTAHRSARTIFIEISGRCSARCQFCAQRRMRLAGDYGSHMAPDVFERVLSHLTEAGIIDPREKQEIFLYSWGEPLLNPGLNRILGILRSRSLRAHISSNLLSLPSIDSGLLPVISNMIFSLSGLSQETYGRMHGGKIETALQNFDEIYRLLRVHSPDTKIGVAWHRYKFNEHEFWEAYRYFRRPGILFQPTVAHLNDLVEMIDFLNSRLADHRVEQIRENLMVEAIQEGIDRCRRLTDGFRCPLWDSVVVDENCSLLLCCGTTRKDSRYVYGNILEMSGEEIWRRKEGAPICMECISTGLACWSTSRSTSRDSLPKGGGISRLSLLRDRNPRMIRSLVSRALRSNSIGSRIIDLVKGN